jgi:predicted metal-binding membrane protein
MPMTDMQMPGQTWPAAAVAFLGMWVVMMAAMMLPSVAPVLWRYWRAVTSAGETCPGLLTGVVGAGYLSVWTAFGLAAFTLGSALPALARVVPIAVCAVMLIAGLFQFSTRKVRHLACWRETPWRVTSPSVNKRAALRSGLRLGLECVQSCAGLMAIMLISGMMDLRAMVLMGAAIAAERFAPGGERVAYAIGAVIVTAGLFLLAKTVAPLLTT